MPERGRADPVEEACRQLAGYVAKLESLTTEPPAPDGAPARLGSGASTPEPYGHAGQVLMTTLEGIRRLLASIRLATTGHPGVRLPMSDEATALVLAALPKLAQALTDEELEDAVGYLGRRVGDAQSVHGIDERRRLRHLPRRAGEALPPRCPACGCFQLVADLDARLVFCTYLKCPGDRNGLPPVATLTTSADGRPALAWADGLTEMAPDLEGDSPGDLVK